MSEDMLGANPLSEDDEYDVWERFAIGAEARGHRLIAVGLEHRFCLRCYEYSWFGLSHERNEIGHEFVYGYCISGKHHNITERLGFVNRRDVR